MENLRQRALRTGIQGGDELKQLLKAELKPSSTASGRPVRHRRSSTEVIMMVGVNGTGKTTTTGKLAAHFTSARPRPSCSAPPTPSAPPPSSNLKSGPSAPTSRSIKTKQGGDPSAVALRRLRRRQGPNTEVLIVDTAGRLHTKTNLMDELDKMRRTAEKFVPGAPHQILLVIDATTGQNGLQQARIFTEAAHVTGIVLTKLDGTAKGGIVIAIATELKLPVSFVGIGEKLEDIIPFEAAAFIDSLLD